MSLSRCVCCDLVIPWKGCAHVENDYDSMDYTSSSLPCNSKLSIARLSTVEPSIIKGQ